MIKYSDINQEKTFQIINSLLPLQSCIYHQVIPIEINDNYLIVGMIKPDDELILDYLTSILPSPKHTIKVEQISPQTHNLIISAYQKYTRSYKASEKINDFLEQELLKTKESKTLEPSQNNSKKSLAIQETFIINPEDFKQLKEEQQEKEDTLQEEDTIQEDISKYSASLEINAPHQNTNLESLKDLTAEQFWQELLFRLLTGGIGRLYFERNADYGTITLTQNGVVKSSLQNLNLSLFQELFTAVKVLANLPETTIKKSRKIEIERIYHQKRILLRFHLFPGQHGEQGTIQVLRDKALSFYQEKQMDTLGEEALNLTKQLERKLQQIQNLKRINPSELDFLRDIQMVQARINSKLKELKK